MKAVRDFFRNSRLTIPIARYFEEKLQQLLSIAGARGKPIRALYISIGCVG
jgi:hypothetical protein